MLGSSKQYKVLSTAAKERDIAIINKLETSFEERRDASNKYVLDSLMSWTHTELIPLLTTPNKTNLDTIWKLPEKKEYDFVSPNDLQNRS